eukprot:m51a1_g2063 putative oligosaccharyl transferase-like protein (1135) ;mRNA; r:1428517-1433401
MFDTPLVVPKPVRCSGRVTSYSPLSEDDKASGVTQDYELRQILLSPCLQEEPSASSASSVRRGVALPCVGASPMIERACNPLAAHLLEREGRRRPPSVSSPIPIVNNVDDAADLGLLRFSPVRGYTITVENRVEPCIDSATGQRETYTKTLKIFPGNLPAGEDLERGASKTYDSSSWQSWSGVGIQENGMYCRAHGDEPTCINPDNAGMQLVLTSTSSCTQFELKDPFYCGKYPPNAKKVLSVSMSGTYPACVATITRLPNALKCQSNCPKDGPGTTSSSKGTNSGHGSNTNSNSHSHSAAQHSSSHSHSAAQHSNLHSHSHSNSPSPSQSKTQQSVLMGAGARLFHGAVIALACVALYYSVREAYAVRMYAVVTYGRIIHEFDPWFNFRATEYLWANGWRSFFTWFDHSSWYPIGRPVGTTIFPGMQFTAVLLTRFLNLFGKVPFLGLPISLNDVCVLIPAWFGCLASLFVGLMTYEATGGSVPSLAASAAVMALIPAHILRSVAGGFDNESVAVPAMCLTFWLWLLSLRSRRTWPVGALAGLAYAYMSVSWGGHILAGNLVALHAAVIVVMGRWSRQLGYSFMLFWIISSCLSSVVPVVGLAPFRSLEQAGPMVTFAAFVCLELLHVWSSRKRLTWTANYNAMFVAHAVVAAVAAVVIGSLMQSGYFWPASIRVRSLFVEHTRTGNPLVDSVAEHQAASSGAYSMYLHSCYQALPLGAGMLLLRGAFDHSSKPRTFGVHVTKYFVIVYTVVVYYFASRMARLLLLMGPVASSLTGVTIGTAFDIIINGLHDSIFASSASVASAARLPSATKDANENAASESKKAAKETRSKSVTTKSAEPNTAANDASQSFTAMMEQVFSNPLGRVMCMGLAALFLAAVVYPRVGPFYTYCHEVGQQVAQPHIMFKGRLGNGKEIIVRDYLDAYEWLRASTPEDARVLAWWDYGYHISGIANRTSLADGNTWNLEHIATIGRMLTMPERKGWDMARMVADYVLVWAGEGGDLSKSPHMARIASSVYDDICPKGDDLCRSFGFDRNGSPSKTMRRSMLFKMVSGGTQDPNARSVNPQLFEEVYKSQFGLVRIYRILDVDEESKRWLADPANRLCDRPGGWYCPGQYPPGFPRPPKTHRNIKYN